MTYAPSRLFEVREAIIIAWQALRSNKLRSALTILGVVIGIVTVTLMGTTINGITKAFRQSISSMGADVLFVGRFPWMSFEDWRTFRNRKPFSAHDAQELERLSTTVAAVALQADDNATVMYDRRKVSGAWIVGNVEASLYVRGLTMAKGRFINTADVASQRNVCVIGSYLAEGFFPHDEPIGKRIRVADTAYEVVGVLEKQGAFFGGWNQDNQVVVPISRFAMDFDHYPDYVIAVKARDPAQVQETKEELRAILRRLRKVAPDAQDDFAINQQEAFLKFFMAFGGTIAIAGLFVTSLSLFVGGIGIMNIMFVSVAERTKEIGIRKALGAKRRTILIQFLVEAATITLGAGLVGLAIAWPATLAINEFSTFAAEMSWPIAIISILVSIATGVVAGFIPAWRAARMDPVEALRIE
ncbi:MAG TPA: ABC transporter permease [Candidatus Limnocylindria bacterium]|jgi:putative ABC transport system permease protein|nr:ABC transporter permease [Candidatus Limnocylindria bacterium]